MASKPSLALKRRFKASPAQLFEAWTQPQKMICWWGVTGHPKAPIAEAEVKVGGGFRVQFHRPDGDSTILTLTHEQFFNETARDDHRRGWTLALDNLEKVFP